ncbi:PLP-dependent aminotransferase family protein [Brucella sp. BE17]|uniref:aminotransferase-like domain-containing protein n=1 Tax=Brucella sp. BE17 TaxID=3142977 RepID=UPI0031BA6A83
MNIQYAKRMNGIKPSAIRSLNTNPQMIFFGGGYPDGDVFPVDAIRAAFDEALKTSGKEALQYSSSIGLPKLRQQIVERMKHEQVDCTMDNILILQGAQQGLDLAARLLVDKGDTIITEAPTFLGALGAFAACEPQYETVAVDENGLDTDALEALLKQNPRAKLLYTIPDFHNPTGVTMSLDRRKALIALANKYDLIVLEDTPYREVYFDAPPPVTLKSLDEEGRVIYLGSFSKILSPGLRLGWAVASEEIIQKMTLLKLGADTQCSTLNMTAVSHLLDVYDLDGHITSIRKHYKHKRDVMLGAVREHLPQDIHFTHPAGGLFTWLTFPESFDARKFLLECAIPKFEVGYVPGDPFYAESPQLNHARVSFSSVPVSQIDEGILRLGEALRNYVVG